MSKLRSIQVQVSGLVADEKGVSAVYVNGVLADLASPTSAEVSESGFSGKVVKFAADAMLAIGENTIEVRAISVNGNQAKNVFKIQRTTKADNPTEVKPKLPQIWAVVVGISEYQDRELQLHFAHKDAQAFYGFLKSPSGGAIPDERIELLTNRNATRAEIIRALNDKLRMAFEDDIVIIYIASHGTPRMLAVSCISSDMMQTLGTSQGQPYPKLMFRRQSRQHTLGRSFS